MADLGTGVAATLMDSGREESRYGVKFWGQALGFLVGNELLRWRKVLKTHN